jgi:hypothetical protein
VFDEEISTSKPLLEHRTSILGVWVNHVIIHKDITLCYRNKNKNKKHEGTVMGKSLVVSNTQEAGWAQGRSGQVRKIPPVLGFVPRTLPACND